MKFHPRAKELLREEGSVFSKSIVSDGHPSMEGHTPKNIWVAQTGLDGGGRGEHTQSWVERQGIDLRIWKSYIIWNSQS